MSSNVSFFMLLGQIKSSDTSTAESGSEVEEITSPKATRSYSEPRLTPVREEVSVCLIILCCLRMIGSIHILIDLVWDKSLTSFFYYYFH